MNTKEEILGFIAQKLREKLDSRGISRGQIAKGAKVGKTTVVRIVQDEITVSSLSAANAFSLLTYVLENDPSQAASLMRIAYPNWYNTFGRYLCNISDLKETEDSQFVWTSVMSQIFEQCFSKSGASSAWIVKKWGTEIGMKAAELLREKGLIKLVQGSYYPYCEETIESDHANNLSLMAAQLASIDPSSIGLNSWYRNTIHSLPTEYHEKFTNNIKEFNLKQKQVVEEAKNSGLSDDKVIVMNLFGYTFDIED